MNSSYRKVLAVLALVQVSLLSVASAHPGAPGHTHGDDWPFDLMPAVGVGVLAGVAVCVFRMAKKKAK